MPRTIIIVDDDEAVRESLAALLRSAGYRAGTCATGPEFLAVAQMARPDGVILDHHMGGMSGVELAERLAREMPRTKIVMISGNLTDAMRLRAERAGVLAVLEKPFPDDALVATIEAQIGRPETR